MKKTLTSLFCLLLLSLPSVAAPVVFGVVPATTASVQGVEVARVAEGTPAHSAGMQAGDVILRVQGQSASDAAALKAILSTCKPGDVLRVHYLRGDSLHVALVELQARPGADSPQKSVSPVELPPELLLQFAQARNRLRGQLARLPYRMNTAQVLADMQEVLMLARGMPSGYADWMQGSSVEAVLELPDTEGTVILRADNGCLLLELHSSDGVLSYPLDSTAQREKLPTNVIRRLQKL